MKTIEEYLLSIIPAHPHDPIRMAMEKFGITRKAVHHHMKKLINRNLVELKGSRNKAAYHLLEKNSQSKNVSNEIIFTYKVGEKGESEIWKQDIESNLGVLPGNIKKICSHGFTEIFNNVIDHSGSPLASVKLSRIENTINITVADMGIGIFKKVAIACGFDDYRDAIIKIHQGKFTTDRRNHSGEGIFFTSRIFDSFSIIANGFFYYKDNSIEDDWYFEQHRNEKTQEGTVVVMKISLNSKREIQDIFEQYANKNDFKFDKSHMRISLAKYDEDEFISRSQAKRILHKLDGFQEIILDFADVRSVGQAFVDEVFGVFALEHPLVEFKVINANSDVIFMIKRGLANRDGMNHKVIFGLVE